MTFHVKCLEEELSEDQNAHQNGLSFLKLKALIERKEIDTILYSSVDMLGRLIGKRMTGRYFLKSGYKEALACTTRFCEDIDQEFPVPGYKSANWETGYGDFAMVPDPATLRVLPWLPRTALVICDAEDKTTHADLSYSPRAILKRQISRLTERGLRPYFASELEFYLFDETVKSAKQKRWKELETNTTCHQSDMIFLSGRDDELIRAIRNGLESSGIPVEDTKGEWGYGQHEINIEYTDALEMADRHVILKQAVREMAEQRGKTVTFMAKYDDDCAGSSGHIHSSLWSLDGKVPLFLDKNSDYGMSALMRAWVAGQLKYARQITCLLAPNINFYKRFQSASFAPTNIAWSLDNRTAAFRLCAERSSSIRVECRIGGADLNPYLAYAGIIAAGLAGIDEGLKLGAPSIGDLYKSDDALPEIPKTLREAFSEMEQSKMLKNALGDEVVEHYVHAAKWEQSQYDTKVTDWELSRGFDRY